MSETPPARRGKRWLGDEARRVRGPLVAALGAGSVGGALLIVQALVLARLIDRAVFDHQTLHRLAPWLALLAAVFVLRTITVYLGERAASAAALRVKSRVRAALMEHVQALGPAWLAGTDPGELANTVVDGVEALEGYFARYLPQAALAVIVPVAVLALVFPIDWISGLVLAVTAPLIPIFMILIGKGAQALNERQWRKMGRLSAHFYEVLAGLGTLKAFGAGRAEARLVERLSDEYRVSTMGVLRVAFLSSLALEFLATVGIAMVAVLVGFRLLWGDIPFAAGLAALLLAPEFYLPLRNLGQAYHARLAAVAAAERIADILDRPTPPRGGTASFSPAGPVAIEFEDVTFAYEAGKPALAGVGFSLPAGGQLAIVGPSGAGKSTLLYLLLGFAAPDTGRIRVDGRPLAEIDLRDWHRCLAWVPRQPHLFAGTVADNIRLGSPGADDEAIRHAARAAHADGFIDRLPEGFDTPLGEDGAGLSGGEIRRVAIARALLRDPRLLVLDEPTASLDAESEAAVAAALDTLARGRTVVTVAHRLHTVCDADRILVLENGRPAASGRHAELLEASGLYRDLVSAAPAAEPSA